LTQTVSNTPTQTIADAPPQTVANTATHAIDEELIITSSLIIHSKNLAIDDSIIIDFDQIAKRGVASLGNQVNQVLGVHNSDYGAAVGQPIVRGLSDGRIKILQNNLEIRDVAQLGADHVNEAQLANLQQVEIIRGPASLLYSNGTIGGIINIITNTIPKENIAKQQVTISSELQSVNEGSASQINYQNNFNGVNLTANIDTHNFGDYQIPEGAIEEEHHDEEEMAEHEEEHQDTLANTDWARASVNIGLSKVNTNNYYGLSVVASENTIGIPFHVEEGGHDLADEHDEEEEHHEDERIVSETTFNRFDLQGGFDSKGLISNVKWNIAATDYQLNETHEEAHEEEGEEHSEDEEEQHGDGSTFKTAAIDAFAVISFKELAKSFQKVSIQLSQVESEVTGEESALLPTTSNELLIGYFYHHDLSSNIDLDFGVRLDSISRDGQIMANSTTTAISKQFDDVSFSLNLSRQFNDKFYFDVSLSRVARAPTTSELYFDGFHTTSQRYERGNQNIESELGTNIDLSAIYKSASFDFSLALFNNQIANYIYLQDTEQMSDDGNIIADYLQQNATFSGYEFAIGKTFQLFNNPLEIRIGRDFVDGQFDSGGYIPRLVPSRNLIELSYQANTFNIDLQVKSVDKQTNVATNETETDGYNLIDLYIDNTWSFGQTQLLGSFFIKNALNEIVRNHTSYVKAEVPNPGLNIGLRLQLTF